MSSLLRESNSYSAEDTRAEILTIPRRARLALLFLISLLTPAVLSADFAAGVAAYERGDYLRALKEWKPIAAQGDPTAQARVASLYLHGQGVRIDVKEAAKWYLLAGQQGNLEAERYLGFAYEKGVGVPQNYQEAAKWYRLAAEKGNLDAQRYLGYAYRTGQGVSKNFFESAKWYLMAESQKWRK